MPEFNYEFSNGTLTGYISTQEQPLILQPHRPDGTPWDSEEEAVAWWNITVEELLNPVLPEGVTLSA